MDNPHRVNIAGFTRSTWLNLPEGFPELASS